MKHPTTRSLGPPAGPALCLLSWHLCQFAAHANPTGGVAAQGTAAFKTTGSQLTITTSASTFINWQSFNIGAGETTTFVQPSASSVVWNQINDANPSQILGTLNANGYVVLQNQNGFVVGGQASINTHGLVMTTAATPALNLSSGGAWTFNAPPPLAKIINYGQINIAGGGSAFLIANDIENDGAISAPSGNIGLYAGETVLVSMTPDGRSLSARVTLPQGSVDNAGHLIADGGAIAAQAQTVNQNGLVQANAVQNVNGVIELVAGDSLTLGASSDIEANGDASAASASPGGFVVLQSGNTYADTPTSVINVAGQNGGQAGIVDILGNGSVQSVIGESFATLINPFDLTLSANPTDISTSDPNFNLNDLAAYSQIDLHASDNIELSAPWSLAAASTPVTLSLQAGNNIIFDDRTDINAGNDWNVNLTAGTGLTAGTLPASGSDGIYLNGAAYLQTTTGSLNLWAANEVQVGWAGGSSGAGVINPGTGRITTTGDGAITGGSLSVTTEYGDINTGSDINGYTFGQKTAPYYKVNASLGGISTADGGSVTLAAGTAAGATGNVISYLPLDSDYLDAQYDAGSGAFGALPGNVTISAGGNVYGHFVLANGVGTVTAGGDIGAPLSALSFNPGDGFALSLINGGWSAYAPNGSIYVQDVRNPNGMFGEKNSSSSPQNDAGYHVFDYSPQASLLLDAGDSVEITGYDAPDSPPSSLGNNIPILFPPEVTVIAGAGGFILDTPVVLFPSTYQSLNITTLNGGNFGIPNSENPYQSDPVPLEMSDSSASQWTGADSFQVDDQAATLTAFNNSSPVQISISGSINAVNLYTTKAATITVGGDMINCGFLGANLSASDVTSIAVTGQIYNSPLDSFVPLTAGIASANPSQPAAWDSVFELALNPALAATIASLNVNNLPGGLASLPNYLKDNNYLLFPGSDANATTYGNNGANVGFIYDPNSEILGFQGVMANRLTPGQISALAGGTLTVLLAGANGQPLIANGHLETATYTFSAAPEIAALATASLQSLYDTSISPIGYQIDGPGAFQVSAASINLGNTPGIASLGFQGNSAFSSLLPTPAQGGASISVTTGGDLDMITSSIFSQDGGAVTVAAGGNINLSEAVPVINKDGTVHEDFFDLQTDNCYGIYTSGHSDVSVTATGDINIGTARIATFDGGNVNVESYAGDVNTGSGVSAALIVYGVDQPAGASGPQLVEFGGINDPATLLTDPAPYGCGILAELPIAEYQTDGVHEPGNITVTSPRGNIISSSGGISQFALNGAISGPVVTLSAGIKGVTDPKDPDAGNIELGEGGVVGGQLVIDATGQIQGFFVSQQDLNLQGNTFTGLGLAGQTANVSANEAGAGPALVVGIGAVNATGLGSSATLLGQNVSANGGAAQSTLGTSVNASAASQSAAGTASDQAKQQLATNSSDSDDEKKKKKLSAATLKVKRVTIILPGKPTASRQPAAGAL